MMTEHGDHEDGLNEDEVNEDELNDVSGGVSTVYVHVQSPTTKLTGDQLNSQASATEADRETVRNERDVTESRTELQARLKTTL